MKNTQIEKVIKEAKWVEASGDFGTHKEDSGTKAKPTSYLTDSWLKKLIRSLPNIKDFKASEDSKSSYGSDSPKTIIYKGNERKDVLGHPEYDTFEIIIGNTMSYKNKDMISISIDGTDWGKNFYKNEFVKANLNTMKSKIVSLIKMGMRALKWN